MVRDEWGDGAGDYWFYVRTTTQGETVPFDVVIADTIASVDEVKRYEFTMLDDDSLLIRLKRTSGDLFPRVSLQDSLGAPVAESNGTSVSLDYMASPGVYTLVVEDDDGSDTGSFWFYVKSWNGITSEPIELGSVVVDSIATLPDINIYTFSVSENDSLIFRMKETSGGFWPWVDLRDTQGNHIIGSEDDYWDDFNVRIGAGNYSLVVRDEWGDDTKQYWFYIQSWNLVRSQAVTIDLDVDVEGALAEIQDIRGYRFQAPSGESVHINFRRESGQFEPEVHVRDSSDVILGEIHSNSNMMAFEVDLSGPGPYTVFVRDTWGDETGTFTLRVEGPEPEPSEDSFTYDESFPVGRYFLLSVPLAFEDGTRLAGALENLGPRGRTTWMGFGLAGGELEPNAEMAPGFGCWLAVADVHPPLGLEGLALPSPLSVPLEPGWSIVGIPDVALESNWSDVTISTVDGDYAFGSAQAEDYVAANTYYYVDDTGNFVNDGFYDDMESFESMSENPWGGYMVLAHQACNLVFPESTAVRRLARQAGESAHRQPDWTVSFAAESAESRDANVSVGVMTGSRSGYDPGDVFKPPMPPGGVGLAVLQDGPHWPQFMRAYDDPSAGSYAWTLSVEGDTPYATLSWTGVPQLPENLRAYLVNPATNQAVDMRREDAFLFVLEDGERIFRVVVSEEDYSGEILGEGATRIASVFPQPSAGRLVIDYELAHTGPFKIRLFDISGREIERVGSGIKDRGRHLLSWDGTGARLGAGVYFLRIDNRGESDARKILIID
ncbi:MAG: T9SS type A sorting domain-containing protein [Candidatus Eisenbacteria bacterium]|nr:T9SS type A sorting domain-containing protein [Candidatus Eisenbacteria bacterium]